jgi:hypothetical protein
MSAAEQSEIIRSPAVFVRLVTIHIESRQVDSFQYYFEKNALTQVQWHNLDNKSREPFEEKKNEPHFMWSVLGILVQSSDLTVRFEDSPKVDRMKYAEAAQVTIYYFWNEKHWNYIKRMTDFE